MTRHTLFPIRRIALLACWIGASCALADDSPATAPEAQSRQADSQPSGTAREVARERLRQVVNRHLQISQDRLERLRRLQQQLDEGTPLPEIRREFNDLLALLGEGPGGPGAGPGRRREAGGGPDVLPNLEPGRVLDRPGAFDDLDRPLPGSSALEPRGDQTRRGPNAGPGGRNQPDHPRRPALDDRGDRPDRPDRNTSAQVIEVGEAELSFVEEFLESSAPRVLERFRELRKRDPEEARRRFVEMFPRVRFLYQMREHDPEMFRLRLQDIRAGREALEAARDVAMFDSLSESGATTSPDREIKVDRLRQALRHQYQVRTDIMKLDLATAKSHSDTLAADIEKRAAPGTADVEKFVQSLIDRESKWLKRRGMSEGDRPGVDERRRPDTRP